MKRGDAVQCDREAKLSGEMSQSREDNEGPQPNAVHLTCHLTYLSPGTGERPFAGPLLPHACCPEILVACEAVERVSLGIRLSVATS